MTTTRKPEGIVFSHHGTWLRVSWSYKYELGDVLAGFNVWYSNTGGAPVWTVPPAFDVGIPSGDGGIIREYFTAMVRIADGLHAYWENFESYEIGEQDGLLDFGDGVLYDGPWLTNCSEHGDLGFGDSFEGYLVGEYDIIDGGAGWSGAWYHDALAIDDSGFDAFEQYDSAMTDFNSGIGWSSSWYVVS